MANGNNPTQGTKSSKMGTQPVWRSNARSNEPVHWGSIDPNSIRGAVDTITRAGGAIMLGLTTDGGAYSLCVLYGTQKVKEYPHSTEECEQALASMQDWFANLIV